MLAIDFLEFFRSAFVVILFVHQVQALIVELVCRFIDEGLVFGKKLVVKGTCTAAAEHWGQKHKRKRHTHAAVATARVEGFALFEQH